MTARQDSDPPVTSRWVFVGGTGRSGTTVTARSIAAAGDFTLVPTELRFHVDLGGLLDLANGEVTLARFRKKLLGPWFERQTPGGVRGICQYIDRDGLEAVLDNLGPADGDPRRLAREIWTQVTTSIFGSGRLVEMSPPNVMRADDLSRVLDHDAVMVDVVRDGRDVAFSVARMRWGPPDPMAALHWWAHRTREAEKARRMCGSSVLTVRLEELASDRGRCAEELARHLGGVTSEEIAAEMSQITPEGVKSGRWRENTPADEQDKIDRAYRRLWLELRDDGVGGLPAEPYGPVP